MPDLNSGTVLANRYTLKRRLGAGALTETWLASDKMTRASVALKVSASQSDTTDLLRREWQLSIRLVHPHIVRVFEFGDDDGRAFYSQQFIDGPDVSVLAGAPLADAMPAMAALADALRYAHAKGVVHKDVKASNVLLDENGAPYLIDFGVSAEDGDDPGGGSVIASSPQLLDGNQAQPSDDVFALGSLLYEMISGQSPWSSTDTASSIRNSEPPAVVSKAGDDIPPQLQTLLAGMLSKEAASRPAAAEVCETLANCGYRAGAVPRSYVGERSTQEAAAIEVASIQPARVGQPKPIAQEAPSDGVRPAVLGIGFAVLFLLLIGVVFFLPSAVESPDEPVSQVREEIDTEPDVETPAEPELPDRDERVVARSETEEVLGQLLAKMETLEARAVQRWGGLPYKRAQAVYAAGDEAYLARNYAEASARYEEAITIIDPLLEQVDQVFDEAMANGERALNEANATEAIDAYELAVAISSGSSRAKTGLSRARNLETVLELIDQGSLYEKNLEMEAARQSFSRAVELYPEWPDAKNGLARINATILKMEFESRMSEGINALSEGDFLTARAAFRMAEELRPGAPEPADGLLQVDQGMRLQDISSLEEKAHREERNEQWEMAVETYDAILELDSNLLFAQDGKRSAQAMVSLHKQIDDYIENPDSLSSPRASQTATGLIIDITRMPAPGPRLTEQRDELTRLLKRASTPLVVQLVSDNKTAVSIYKIGRLGSFETHQLELKPGTYVAVGSRQGYRDVRKEFRVAPEVEMQPVVVRCEEPI